MMNLNSTRDTSPHHDNFLDGWRGLAILFLLIGHFFPVPGINFGTIGVNLFFVLSGMLMAGLLFEKKEPLARFYRRRIARIIPAHFVFIFAVTFAHYLFDLPISARELFSALIFLNNYVLPNEGPGFSVMPFGHIWSLSVEEHSYIVLSIVAIASRRRYCPASSGVSLLLILCICFAGYYQWVNPPKLAFVQWLHTEVAAFGLVGAAWWVAIGRPVVRKWRSTWAAPMLVLVGVLLHWWSIPLFVQKLLGVGCFVAAICMLTVERGWFAVFLTWSPFRQLGLWSYSLYLWQQPFYLLMHRDMSFPPLLALVLAIICGLLSYYLVERPTRTYLNTHWRGRNND